MCKIDSDWSEMKKDKLESGQRKLEYQITSY